MGDPELEDPMLEDPMLEDDVVHDLLAGWRSELDLEREVRALLAPPDDEEWLPLPEAEQAAGVSRSTLRAWYRSGRVPSRLVPGPHGLQRLVPRRAIVEQAARSPRVEAPRRRAGTAEETSEPPADVVRLAELAVTEARDRAAKAERRADAAEAALRAALERAAAAEALVRELRSRR